MPGDCMQFSWNALTRNGVWLYPLLILVAASGLYLALLPSQPDTTRDPTAALAAVGATFLLEMVFMVVSLFVGTWHQLNLRDLAREKRIELGNNFRASFLWGLKILVLEIVVAAPIVLVFLALVFVGVMVASAGSTAIFGLILLALAIGVPLLVLITIFLAFSVIAAIFEDKWFEAYGRAWSFMWRHLGPTLIIGLASFGIILVLLVPYFIAVTALAGGLSALGTPGVTEGLTHNPVYIFLQLVFGALIGVVGAWSTLAMMRLYLTRTAQKRKSLETKAVSA
jgi:hypothetical protein